MEFSDLATVNAALNGLSLLFLTSGYYWIRRGEKSRHKAAMLCACVTSALFLASYLVYHSQVGSVPYQGRGWIRPVYFAILISHIVLAVAIVPLAGVTLARAWRGSFDRHRRIARWTWPLWVYVSLTGIAIYWMLYHG